MWSNLSLYALASLGGVVKCDCVQVCLWLLLEGFNHLVVTQIQLQVPMEGRLIPGSTSDICIFFSTLITSTLIVVSSGMQLQPFSELLF